MKYLFLLLLSVVVASCGITNENPSHCFPDKGIKLAVTTATLLPVGPESRTASERQHFNKEGRIILREEVQRNTQFVYKSGQLEKTIVTDFTENGMTGSIDTNYVATVDELGRPLTFSDEGEGDKIELSYNGCKQQVYLVKDSSGKTKDEITSFLKKGVLKSTVWKSGNSEDGQITKYYDYKFDDKGKWIERKYDYNIDGAVIEEREIIYY